MWLVELSLNCELTVWLHCLNVIWIEDFVCRIYRHENSETIFMQAEKVGFAMASGGEQLRITLILTGRTFYP